jgi:histone RNA hairpin-binding protein
MLAVLTNQNTTGRARNAKAAARKHRAILVDVDKENHPTSGGGLAPSKGDDDDGARSDWGRKGFISERETDPSRLKQRLKQITWGKNTLGYDRYTALVPRCERRRDDTTTPTTPDHTRVLAKRRWDGLVSAWRRALHAYDPPGFPSAAQRRTATLLKVRRDTARSDRERTARGAAQEAAAQQHALEVRRQQRILQILRIASAMMGQSQGQGQGGTVAGGGHALGAIEEEQPLNALDAARIAELEAENAQLRASIGGLEAENAQLQASKTHQRASPNAHHATLVGVSEPIVDPNHHDHPGFEHDDTTTSTAVETDDNGHIDGRVEEEVEECREWRPAVGDEERILRTMREQDLRFALRRSPPSPSPL